MLNSRASVQSVINRVMSQADGIGTSKSQSRADSEKVGQNGQSISTKAHSISTKEALRSTTTQLLNHIKENNAGRVISNINNDTIKDYINHKIEQGNKLSSINSEISLVAKIVDNLNELNIHTADRETITDYRHELKEQGHNLQGEKIDRTNSDSIAIVQAMNNDSPYGLSASLQHSAGMRVDDSLNFEKLTVNSDNSISIEGSKNGLNYTTCQVSQEIADRTREAINNNISVSYSEYRTALKEATEGTGQDFKGTHSLRYDHINERHEQNINERNMTELESKSELSIQNGHSREEITDLYLQG